MAREKVSSSVKSGNVNTDGWVAVLGGMPPKKTGDAVEKANQPEKCPSAIGR